MYILTSYFNKNIQQRKEKKDHDSLYDKELWNCKYCKLHNNNNNKIRKTYKCTLISKEWNRL